MKAPWYQRAWLVLLIVIAALEIHALWVRRQPGDTLSEYVWAKVRHPVLRGALGGLLVWLVYHFLYAGPGMMGTNDVIATVAGIAIGLASVLVRRKG